MTPTDPRERLAGIKARAEAATYLGGDTQDVADDTLALVAAVEAAQRVIDEAIEDVTAAYTDTSRSEAGRQRSAMIRRVLLTLRDDASAAITAALTGEVTA